MLVASTAAGVAAVVSTVFAVLRGGSRATRHLASGVALLTVALFAQAAPAPTFTFGGLHLAWTVQHVAALGAAYLVPSGFARVVEGSPEKVDRFLRPRLALVWVGIAVLVACFAARPRASDWLFGPDGRHEAGGPGDPIASLAHIAFGAYLAQAVFVLTLLSLRAARLAGGRSVAIGMTVHAYGEVPILVYALHVVGYNTSLLLGVVPPWPEADVDQVLMPFGTCSLLLGLTIAAAGGRGQVHALARRVRYDRVRATVHPLWTEVVTAMPAVAYTRLPAARGFPPDPLAERHAYRTVVELRDALVLLCQIGIHVPESDEDDPAARAAEVFAAGLPAWRGGARPGAGEPLDPPVTSAPTLLAELRWWAEVAKAVDVITRSPHKSQW